MDVRIFHNYMNQATDFCHFVTGSDLDIATWDSYPLGFLSDRTLSTDETDCASCAKASPISKPSITTFNAPFAGATDGL